MPSASYAVRSCRLEALLLLAVLSLAGVTLAYRSSPAPSAPPTIVWTAPANGTLQVPATAVIQVQFSAPANNAFRRQHGYGLMDAGKDGRRQEAVGRFQSAYIARYAGWSARQWLRLDGAVAPGPVAEGVT